MLSTWKQSKAKQYARELADDGMIWGIELENYIKADEYSGCIKLSKPGEREIFIDAILDWVQVIYDKTVVIYDTKTNESIIYTFMKEAADSIGINTGSLYNSINQKSKIKKRYYASRYKPKISELNEGIKKLDKTKRSGRIS